jgi:hypothetical protein
MPPLCPPCSMTGCPLPPAVSGLGPSVPIGRFDSCPRHAALQPCDSLCWGAASSFVYAVSTE